MKKFSELIRPKGSRSDSPDNGADTPEANVTRAIKAFCEAGKSKQSAPGPEGIDSNTQVDEVTFLPTIVECTESSPTAALAALNSIRKHVEYKNSKHGHQQYNALMLFRILVDNPGPTFTRGIDEKFVGTVKELYRNTRDPSVRQLLVENLEYCAKKDDQGLHLLKEWYNKEKEKAAKIYSGVSGQSRNAMGAYVGTSIPPPPPPQSGRHGHKSRRSKHQLPPPEELAARISEAQTSAKLLMQILQSTPTSEILSNQLITEFADRCSAASRSIQMFIEADSPAPPDESTMLTLFETNEQLATSLSRHQLAVFSAKQQLKSGDVSRTNSMNQAPQAETTSSPQPEAPTMSAPVNTTGPIPEPVTSTPNYGFSGFRPSQSPPLAETRPLAAPPPPIQTNPAKGDDPFSDPEPARYQGWNSEPQQESSLYTTGRYTPSPVEHSPPTNQGRHPMADVSPIATTAPQMPHGYQPYRY
ncbi:hypothetical protein TWF718_002574 [Orbilia javanica]|uniref:GAT domain-containing protein n=1 Tax=Orbilia javanica TaxID=47235 RepID=A0AAN8MJ08_9PEZI